ncbi:amidinotransferase [Oscillochloris sp. ZM17-4]|uniref:dimethylarginine dimethylaminohydrolase family protein n=1 Tax=Oscillochloris sp. ZM17-4 TaxID=2866714 RepID=UPI001C73B9B4|nr:arginine deiminase family protein [Oscillochloris sp. ZM17-4]MBX0329586.1 amidinotransferase [Oscillochloris sp. ZM17-4]
MPAYGSQSMVAPLRRVLVRRPDAAFAVEDPAAWHYTSRPDLPAAQAEHDALVATLRQFGAEVIEQAVAQPGRADAIFVHDPALVTDAGAIILSMGKPLREGEPEAMAEAFAALDIPIHARLSGEARAEGGDLLWLDHDTLAVGLGFRTNAEGLRQLGAALAPLGAKALPVELPYYTGPDACLHLMSLISLLADDLAVVYSPLLSVPFYQELQRRGVRMVEVPESEFLTMGTNVLALAPGECLMLEGNPITQERLARAGCEVRTYKGDEISLKAEGGATCLTRPILRG